ncbi:MAG: carboxypeptidase-like regulatory domain-containing protein [Planctomycetota bacterium]
MSSRKFLALTLIAAALAIAAFLFDSGSRRRARTVPVDDGARIERVPHAGPSTGSPGGPASVQLADPDRVEVVDRSAATGGEATTVVYPLEVDLTLVLPGHVEVPDGAMPVGSGANASIAGSVVGAAGNPSPAEATFVYGPNAGRTLLTDGRGRFGASDLQPGASIVRVKTPDGFTAEREVLLAQLTTARLDLSFSSAASVAGTIKDDGGQPVVGAEIRLDGRLGYTNQEGQFLYSNVPAGKVLVTARKDGFAVARRNVGVGFRTFVRPDDFVIRLEKGASLELSLSTAQGSLDPAVAVLIPPDAADRNAYPWYEINPIRIPRAGRARIDGLPDCSVNVHVFHRGAVATPASKSARLYGGRTAHLEFDLAPAPALRGRVLDGSEPIADVDVLIEAADRNTLTSKALGMRNPRFALEMITPPIPVAIERTKTNDRGEFAIAQARGVSSTYYVTATTDDGVRRGLGVLVAGDDEVVVQLSEAVETVGTLVVELPGRFQGLPIDLRIQGAPQDPFPLRPGVPLEVEDLAHGTWRIRARWRGTDVVAARTIEIGDEPAVVRGQLPMGAIQGQTEEERRRAQGL